MPLKGQSKKKGADKDALAPIPKKKVSTTGVASAQNTQLFEAGLSPDQSMKSTMATTPISASTGSTPGDAISVASSVTNASAGLPALYKGFVLKTPPRKVISLSKYNLHGANIKTGMAQGPEGSINSTVLKLTIVKEPSCVNLLWHVSPEGRALRTGLWGEKVFHDQVMERASWTQQMYFVPEVVYIYQNNEPVLNGGGWNYSAFYMQVTSKPSHEVLLEMGRDIADTLNKFKGNNTVIQIEGDNFYWRRQPLTWSDVVGTQKAQKMLFGLTGLPEDHASYYVQHAELTHAYFPRGKLDL